MHFPHRARLRALLSAACCAAHGAGLPAGASTATAEPSAREAADSKAVGHFTEWGTYDRKYHDWAFRPPSCCSASASTAASGRA